MNADDTRLAVRCEARDGNLTQLDTLIVSIQRLLARNQYKLACDLSKTLVIHTLAPSLHKAQLCVYLAVSGTVRQEQEWVDDAEFYHVDTEAFLEAEGFQDARVLTIRN